MSVRTQKQAIANLIAGTLQTPEPEVAALIEYPPNPQLGDLALPCFRFAKALRKSPQLIANEIATVLTNSGQFSDVSVAGGYVNVKAKREALAADVIRRIGNNPVLLFSSHRGSGHRVAVDYSSPNIAKPFGVGHLRSTVIGESLVRLFRADGYDVIGINHLGDWGTQFGKNIAAYLRWGDEATVKQDPVRELLKLYVRFHDEAKASPELEDEGRQWFKRLEDGDPEARRLWQWFIDESLKVFEQTYRRLGVTFDYYLGESFYNDKMDAVVEELSQKRLLVESDGAEVVDLSAWNMPPCIIRKSDGATIYATRDLSAAVYRHDQLGADRLIYVVGAEQILHFQQVFKVLELMRLTEDWPQNCRHVAFGMMKYNGERLSTRRGKVIYLEDVLSQAIDEARRIIEEKNPALPDKDAVSEAVGIGAVVFNDLKTYRMHDVDFRFEEVLNFDGETGPYVQYTHARACSVLRKAEDQGLSITLPEQMTPLDDTEWRLIHQISQAGELFNRAVDEMDPSLMARFVLDTCHAFNRFYHDNPILTASEAVRNTRLAFTKASQQVIGYALYLLGLKAPEAM